MMYTKLLSCYNISNYNLQRPVNSLLDALEISHQRLVEESMRWAANERGSLDLHTSNSLASLPLHLSHLVACPCCCQRTAGRLHWECHTFCLVRIATRTEPFELPSGRFWFVSHAAMQKTTPLDRQWSRSGPRLFGFATRRCATFREPMDFHPGKPGDCLALLCIWPLAEE